MYKNEIAEIVELYNEESSIRATIKIAVAKRYFLKHENFCKILPEHVYDVCDKITKDDNISSYKNYHNNMKLAFDFINKAKKVDMSFVNVFLDVFIENYILVLK